MTDADRIVELTAALDAERTERAEERLAVLAMMAAVDEHLASLRKRLEAAADACRD